MENGKEKKKNIQAGDQEEGKRQMKVVHAVWQPPATTTAMKRKRKKRKTKMGVAVSVPANPTKIELSQ